MSSRDRPALPFIARPPPNPAGGVGPWRRADAARAQAAAAPDPEAGKDLPSLKGKTIAISVAGTDHFFDVKTYQAQVETVKEFGGTPIGLDAGRDDKALVSQLQKLVTQRPEAVIQTLGTVTVIDPWLKKLRQAGIPVFSVDVPSTNVINAATSDNFSLGAQLALQLVSDIGGMGNLVVFNGFSGVPVCEIRYNELRSVLKYYPNVKILESELRDVIPNTVQDAYAQITALPSRRRGARSLATACSRSSPSMPACRFRARCLVYLASAGLSAIAGLLLSAHVDA